MLHLLEHTLEETWLMFPILYITYLVIEHFERKESNDDFLFIHLQKFGPVFGAIVGMIPQCGFSIIASMLYLNRYITLGTLISVFIATSDEAIPVLLANPHLFKEMIGIIILKLIVAIVAGYIVDKIVYPKQKLVLFNDLEEVEDDEIDEDEEPNNNACPCCYIQYPLPVSAFLRSLKIFAFIFAVTFILNVVIHENGENIITTILSQNTFLQIILASIIGFIPNCVTSVVLTQLYVANQITYASLFSGLVTNAGLGIVALIRYQATKKEIIRVIVILLITAMISGLLIQALI